MVYIGKYYPKPILSKIKSLFLKDKNKSAWIMVNKMCKTGEENYGALLHFTVNNLVWDLNYCGDAPLLIFHKASISMLQVDGDLFEILEEKLADTENDEEHFDFYHMEMEVVLDFLNTMLYEDMELEKDERLEDNDDPDYDLHYEGNNEKAFNALMER